MDIYAKTILAVMLLIVGFIATLAMLYLHGGREKVRKPNRVRGVHKAFGFVFFILLLVLVFTGMRYVAWGWGEPAARSIIHVVLASALFAVFILKLLIVRFYRGLLGVVSTLGMIVFVLTVLVFSTSAGYYLARRGEMLGWGEGSSSEPAEETTEPTSEIAAGNAEMGAAVYEKNCAFCHYSDRTDSKLGPGLAGVLQAEALPASGRPVTTENIVSTLENPVGTMPVFTKLTEEEVRDLIAFLETI